MMLCDSPYTRWLLRHQKWNTSHVGDDNSANSEESSNDEKSDSEVKAQIQGQFEKDLVNINEIRKDGMKT